MKSTLTQLWLVIIVVIFLCGVLVAGFGLKNYIFTAAAGRTEPIFLHETGTLPSGMSARLTTSPNGPFKDGDEVKFNVRVVNKSKKAQVVDVQINLPTRSRIGIATYAELRNISEPVTRLAIANQEDGVGVGISKSPTHVSWDKRTIPAQNQKDFSITLRLFFNHSECNRKTFAGCHDTLGSFNVMISGTDYKQSAGASIPWSVSNNWGGQRLNKKPVDYMFYAAYKRFPSVKERTTWEKKYWTYKDSDVSLKQGKWFNDMLAAAKKSATKK